MNQKKAKAVRRAVKALNLPASTLMQHRGTGSVIQGPGERAALIQMKRFVKGRDAGLSDAEGVERMQRANARVRGRTTPQAVPQ